MRTALLSTLELTREGQPRAFERLGGRPLIAWQVDLARELGCDRIICLSTKNDANIQEIKALTEQADIEFQLVAGPLPLVGMLSADQELLVVADGLVIDRDALPEGFGSRPGVLALPDEPGIAAGFERIDSEHSWAGILLARANIASQLAEMPPDSDTISLLLRLALQSGAKLIPLASERLDTGEWLLVKESEALATREQALLDQSVERSSWTAPGIALSRRIARALAPDGLARGPTIANALGIATSAGAIGLAQASFLLPALGLFAVAALAFGTGHALSRLKARLLGMMQAGKGEVLYKLLLDLALIASLSLPTTLDQAPRAVFLPLLLIAVLRLAEQMAPDALKQPLQDRVLLALILIVPAWFVVLEPAIAGLSLLTITSCLFFQRKTKITRA